MPEQISKYPDVTLKVLREGGAVCGQGAQQKILKQCPRDRFCSLRTGEICVYGINEIPKMTRLPPRSWLKSFARKLKRLRCSRGFSINLQHVFEEPLSKRRAWNRHPELAR
jgi:hypothetical protein